MLVDGKTVAFKDNIFSMDGNTEMFESEISFNYTKEATKIDIIGTTAIPEFDGLVSAALGLSLLTALVLTHTSRWFNWKRTNKKAQD